MMASDRWVTILQTDPAQLARVVPQVHQTLLAFEEVGVVHHEVVVGPELASGDPHHQIQIVEVGNLGRSLGEFLDKP
jgi:hypothetical protein